MGIFSMVKGLVASAPTAPQVRPLAYRASANLEPSAKDNDLLLQGFALGAEFWLYQPTTSASLRLVKDLGEPAGDSLTIEQEQDIKQRGLCIQAQYCTAPEHYWRQPSEKAVLYRIHSLGLRTPRKQFSPKNALGPTPAPGLWLLVQITDNTNEPAVPAHKLASL